MRHKPQKCPQNNDYGHSLVAYSALVILGCVGSVQNERVYNSFGIILLIKNNIYQNNHSFDLFIAFFQITLYTQHLTVIGCCVSSLAPRNNMIAVHFIKLKLFSADSAFMILLFICR